MARPALPPTAVAGASGHVDLLHNRTLSNLTQIYGEIDAVVADVAALAGGSGGAAVSAPILVASADAPADIKAMAGAAFTCDGTADQVQINAAILAAAPLASRNSNSDASATQRGLVQLTGGRFVISGSILMDTGVTLAGMGRLTEIQSNNITTATGVGSGIGMIKLAASDVHLTVVQDLWLNGNYGSGGVNCSGVLYDQTGSSSAMMGTYPGSSPDANHTIKDLYIQGFSGGGSTTSRCGIKIAQASTTNLRGWMVSGCQIRDISGYGIYCEATPDGHIDRCHVGTIGVDGYYVGSSNIKVTNCKSFYCDGWGYNVSGNRCTLAALETQDDVNGIVLSGNLINAGLLTIDTADLIGLQISGGKTNVEGFTVFVRSGGRTGHACDTGLSWSGSPTDVKISGLVDDPSVGTAISGSPGVRVRGEVNTGTGTTTAYAT